MTPSAAGSVKKIIENSGGSRISQEGNDFAKFSRKLHEIEKIWMPGGGGQLFVARYL